VEPFVALGKELRKSGYRTRIAAHPAFKRFVGDHELEFLASGGDLMAFLVKNLGMIPGRQVILAGEIRKKREAMAEMFEGCWRSCVEAGTGVDDNEQNFRPFIVNTIITSPTKFCSYPTVQKNLKVPLHLMFT
jgi:UDP:flavonoid glycosyltransferase YjiC (YdhE family)